jgi:hypothetical protein
MRQREFGHPRNGNRSGIALVNTILKRGKRLLYSPLTGMTQAQSVCLARATKGNVTPAGERFCEILRKISDRANCDKTKAGKVFLNEVRATTFRRAERSIPLKKNLAYTDAATA